jgi:phenylacetate-coenzyme A ligase PaaK-like adenylate-forming protein
MGQWVDRLIEKEAFVDDTGLFEKAMLECFNFHYDHCEPYRKFCGKKASNLEGIPPILVTALKHYELLSVSKEELALTLTSSGTSGQKTKLFLTGKSLDNLKKIAEKVHGAVGLVNKEETVNYLNFSYEPEHAKEMGTAWSDRNNMTFTKTNQVFYALKWNGRSFYFARNDAVETLKRYSEEGLPVRLLGFPAYMVKALRSFRKKYGSVELGERSWILTGGGWKEKKGEMKKEKFRQMVAEILGMPPENVRDCYGLAEHGIPYVECHNGRMHVPAYSRVEVIDPVTLEKCERGEIGLLKLMTPYNFSTPYLSILTTDWGRMGKGCSCGIESPWIELAGRAGIKKHAGCAVSALEYA